jgi:hypothetical protein
MDLGSHRQLVHFFDKMSSVSSTDPKPSGSRSNWQIMNNEQVFEGGLKIAFGECLFTGGITIDNMRERVLDLKRPASVMITAEYPCIPTAAAIMMRAQGWLEFLSFKLIDARVYAAIERQRTRYRTDREGTIQFFLSGLASPHDIIDQMLSRCHEETGAVTSCTEWKNELRFDLKDFAMMMIRDPMAMRYHLYLFCSHDSAEAIGIPPFRIQVFLPRPPHEPLGFLGFKDGENSEFALREDGVFFTSDTFNTKGNNGSGSSWSGTPEKRERPQLPRILMAINLWLTTLFYIDHYHERICGMAKEVCERRKFCMCLFQPSRHINVNKTLLFMAFSDATRV